jgi:type VI protein secretion system component VasK
MTIAGDGGPRDDARERKAIPPLEAHLVRQGRRTTRLMWVMTVSLVVVALALLAVWAAQLGPRGGRVGRTTRADATQFHQGAPAAKQTPAQSPAGARDLP